MALAARHIANVFNLYEFYASREQYFNNIHNKGKFTNNILCRTNDGDGRGPITIEVLIDTRKTMCILDQVGLELRVHPPNG